MGKGVSGVTRISFWGINLLFTRLGRTCCPVPLYPLQYSLKGVREEADSIDETMPVLHWLSESHRKKRTAEEYVKEISYARNVDSTWSRLQTQLDGDDGRTELNGD